MHTTNDMLEFLDSMRENFTENEKIVIRYFIFRYHRFINESPHLSMQEFHKRCGMESQEDKRIALK